MGHRITQRIYTCDLCNNTPEDGELLWHMGNEVWCKDCCDKAENEKEGNCNTGNHTAMQLGLFKKCQDCGATD